MLVGCLKPDRQAIWNAYQRTQHATPMQHVNPLRAGRSAACKTGGTVMDAKYVEMRRGVRLATLKARDLIRSTEAQINTAGVIDEDGRAVANPFGERLFYRVDHALRDHVSQWIDEVVHAVRLANEDPSEEALERLEFALAQLKAGGRKMAHEDALKWVLSRERTSAGREGAPNHH